MENKLALKVPTMAEMMAKGELPDVLFSFLIRVKFLEIWSG